MQSKILKVLTVGAVSMCAVCSAACVAYAEGSKDLVEYEGYRPYLEWNNLTNLGMDRENVIYVYAKVGETIYFGSSENADNEETIKAVGGNGTIYSTWYSGNDAVGIAVTLPMTENIKKAVEPGAGTDYVLVDENSKIVSDADRNKVYLFNVDKSENGVGYIKDAEQEKKGPNVNGSNTSGYNPLSFTAPYTGTYSFRFLSSEYNTVNGKNVNAVKTDKNWDANGRAVAAFDVTVYGGESGSQTEQSGRVWADRLFLDTGSDKADEGIYSKVYILTDDAFAYELDLNGMSPWGFVLYANKRGFLWDPENIYTTSKKNDNTDETKFNLQSLNRSFYSKAAGTTDTGEPALFNNGTIYPNYKPETDQDVTHRLFFNNPSNSAALKFYTGHKSLADSKSLPNVDSAKVSFEDGKTTNGNGNTTTNGSDNNKFLSSEGYGGKFTVDLKTPGLYYSYPETLALQLDFSGYSLIDRGDLNNLPEIDTNGTWKKFTGSEEVTTAESSNIVTITASGNDGVYTFTWGGLDAYGNVVPRGDYSGIMKISVANGLVHIPLIDIETCVNGIQVKMLNTGVKDDDEIYTVYYNNTKISDLFNPSEAYNKYSIGDNNNMSDGISSEINTEGKSKALQFRHNEGDSTAIDLWTDYYTNVVNDLSIKVTKHATLYPIVSFVDQDGVKNNDSELDKTHLWYKYGDNRKKYYEGHKGGELYGNTISTGFMAEVQNVASDSVRNNVLWTITIPNPAATRGNGHGLYVKDVKGESPTSEMFINSAYNKETVISDDPKAKILNGDIVKINGFDGNETKAVIRLYDNQGTFITGKGAVLYGIVIDGLYAPDATAEIMYVSGFDEEDGVQDLTNADDVITQVHSVDYETYLNSSCNPYNSSSDSAAAE